MHRAFVFAVLLFATVAATAGPSAPDVTHLDAAQVASAFAKGVPLLEVPGYKIHASRREAPGMAEVHEVDTDILYVLEGSATFVTGGQVVDGRTTATDEIRGASIRGGETRTLAKGDVMVVPNGTPHWFRKVEGPLLYYVVKVPATGGGVRLGSGLESPPPTIERADSRLDAIVPADAKLEEVASGFEWVEGPLWNRAEDRLYLADIPRNRIVTWTEAGGVRPFLERSGYTGDAPFTGREPGSNGMTFDRDGRLVVCQHGDRQIVRLEKDGTRTVLADRYDGKRLNSPNDAVFRANGDLYFTDPPFGLPGTFDDPRKELPFQGVYRATPDGEVTLLTKELRAPNGIALSPDEKTLYVANADASRPVYMAYDVKGDGTLGPGRMFFDASAWIPKEKGLPDGMKVDVEGNLFAAGPGGLHVFAPDGTHLGTFRTGRLTSNCGWGGDGHDLFITADQVVYRVRLTTRGP